MVGGGEGWERGAKRQIVSNGESNEQKMDNWDHVVVSGIIQ